MWKFGILTTYVWSRSLRWSPATKCKIRPSYLVIPMTLVLKPPMEGMVKYELRVSNLVVALLVVLWSRNPKVAKTGWSRVRKADCHWSVTSIILHHAASQRSTFIIQAGRLYDKTQLNGTDRFPLPIWFKNTIKNISSSVSCNKATIFNGFYSYFYLRCEMEQRMYLCVSG